jgi:hypothetical protein
MGEIVELKDLEGAAGDSGIIYEFDDDGNVDGITHTEWPFSIAKSIDGTRIALVCKETSETFGEIERSWFNTTLLCWLLIDDPKMVDEVQVGG